MALSSLAGDGRLVVATNSSLRGGKKQDAPRRKGGSGQHVQVAKLIVQNNPKQ
jgi:hypothetical protein